MKIIWILLGFLFVGLGCLGIPLPVLPTTPFLMLACFCFAKGSKKVEEWFKGTKLYKKHLEEFVTHKALTLKAKLTILFTASAMLLLSFGMLQYKAIVDGNSVGNIVGRVIIGCLFPLKYLYFFTRIKTISPEEAEVIRMENERKRKQELMTNPEYLEKIQERRDEEKKTVTFMIQIYCHGVHKNREAIKSSECLCEECKSIAEYACDRSQHCPFIADGSKSFCAFCKIHCYKPEKRDQIKKIMKYSGPRMAFYKPIKFLRHHSKQKKNFKQGVSNN